MRQPTVPIFDSYAVFLLFRIGLPIAGILLFIMLAIIKSTGQAWYILGALLLIIEIEPIFRHGKKYLDTRSATVRHDALWAMILRPIARCFGFENIWIMSFCQWNNHKVREAFQNNRATHALLLLPHCIQTVHCGANVVKELNKCHKCGLCVIGKILSLQIESKCKIHIANRSHKAYKEAQEYQPDLIIAIGCLDRLFKGIAKLSLTPSYVIPLKLSHGMCINTKFNISELVTAMETLVF